MRRMRFVLGAFTITLLASGLLGQQADAPTKSALERTKGAKGWDDLTIHTNFWKRVPLTPKATLAKKSPWKFGDDLLSCDGSAREFLLFDKVHTNGIVHMEARVKRGNAGIVVRTSADGAVHHQVTIGPKIGGAIWGNTLVDGKAAKLDGKKYLLAGPIRVTDVNEWNVCEITMKDKTVSVWMNGYVVAEWPFCDVAKGHVGVKSDGAVVEFKNLKFKKSR